MSAHFLASISDTQVDNSLLHYLLLDKSEIHECEPSQWIKISRDIQRRLEISANFFSTFQAPKGGSIDLNK